jgi:hypothetical protein
LFRNTLRLFLVLAIFAFSAPVGASSPLGGFNGARPLSLGSAYTAQADDAYAFYVDPAGLSELKLFNVFSTYSQLDSDRTFSSLGVVSPGSLYGLTLGLGYRRLALSGLVDVLGNTVDFNEQELGLALAKEVSEGLSFGVELRYISLGQSTGSSSADASGRAFDLAVRRVYRPWLRLALCAQDLAGRLDYQDGTAVNLPYNLVAGVSLDLFGQKALVRNGNELTLNLDVSENRGNPLLLHAGLEWRPLGPIALRAGIDQNFGEAQGASTSGVIFNNFTAGLGLHYGGVTLDYALQRNGDVSGDMTNYLSFTYAYMETTEEAPAAVPQEVVKENPGELPVSETVEVFVRAVKLKHFPDVPPDFWGKREIELLATVGIMWGYADGFFHPQNRVTRGELETILSVGKHLTLVRVSNKERPVKRAEAAARLGRKARIDRPRRPITRAELAKLIYQTDWAQTAIKRLPTLQE